MTQRFDWNRHFILFLVVLFVALAGLSVLAGWLAPQDADSKKPELFADRSVFNAKPSGYQLWYETIQLLQKEKKPMVPIRLWRDNFTQLAKLSSSITLVMIEPSYGTAQVPSFGASPRFKNREVTELLEWVKQGNTLVYLDRLERPQAQLVMKRLGLKEISDKVPPMPKPMTIYKKNGKPLSAIEKALLPIEEQKKLEALEKQNQNNQHNKGEISDTSVVETWEEQPVLVLSDSQDHRSLSSNLQNNAFVRPTSLFQKALAQYQPNRSIRWDILLKTSQTPVLIKVSYGRGDVLLGSMPEIAQNEYLKRKTWDNYQLFTNMILASGKPVYINEFIHGKGESGETLFSYYYQHTPLGRMGVQLFIIFLFILWWSYTNWKPRYIPVLEADAPVSLQAFVTSLSTLYQKANAAPLALNPYWQQVVYLLEKRCRLTLLPTYSNDDMKRLLEKNLLGSSGYLASIGYTETEANKTCQSLVSVYRTLAAQKNAQLINKENLVTEKKLLQWIETMAVLLKRGSSKKIKNPILLK